MKTPERDVTLPADPHRLSALLWGIMLGELVSPLAIVAQGLVRLLQMAVLP